MRGELVSTDRAAAAALIVAVVAISTAAILVREADAAALTIAFWRTALGALVLGPLVVSPRNRSTPLDGRRRLLLLASGACLALHFALFLGSLELTSVASSVTLVSMSPLFVAAGGLWWLDERLDRRTWFGIAAAIVGAVVIGLGDAGGAERSDDAILGDVMAVGGAVAIAGYLLIGRHLRRGGVTNAMFAVPTYAVAAVLLGGVVALRDDPVISLDGRTWLLLGAIVVGPQLLGHGLLTWVLDRLSSTVVSVATLFEPIGATLLAWWLLDELPAELFWVGAPAVLLGLGLVVLGARPRNPVNRW